jgi:cytochrome c oxidase subunit 2
VSRYSYRFKKPGEHLLICHEYCGLGHHAMYGRVIVEPAPAVGVLPTPPAGPVPPGSRPEPHGRHD